MRIDGDRTLVRREYRQRLVDVTELRVVERRHGGHQPVRADAAVLERRKGHPPDQEVVEDVLAANQGSAGRN